MPSKMNLSAQESASVAVSESQPTSVRAWHWLEKPDQLRDGTPVHPGRIYRLPAGQKPILCQQGFHASEKLLDAFQYAPGLWLCRVELSGEFSGDRQNDKLCASQRRILWMLDARPILSAMLAQWAEEQLRWEREHGQEPAPDLLEALETVSLYLQGTATKRDLRLAQLMAQDALDALQEQRIASSFGEDTPSNAGARLVVYATQAAAGDTRTTSGSFGSGVYVMQSLERLGDSTFERRIAINDALEARVLSSAPPEVPLREVKRRWDRSQTLRKPITGKTALAKSLAPQCLSNVETLERLLIAFKRIEQRLSRERDAFRRRTYQLEREAETLYTQQLSAKPLAQAVFSRKFRQAADELRSAKAELDKLSVRCARVNHYGSKTLYPRFNALPAKQRRELEQRVLAALDQLDRFDKAQAKAQSTAQKEK